MWSQPGRNDVSRWAGPCMFYKAREVAGLRCFLKSRASYLLTAPPAHDASQPQPLGHVNSRSSLIVASLPRRLRVRLGAYQESQRTRTPRRLTRTGFHLLRSQDGKRARFGAQPAWPRCFLTGSMRGTTCSAAASKSTTPSDIWRKIAMTASWSTAPPWCPWLQQKRQNEVADRQRVADELENARKKDAGVGRARNIRLCHRI